MVGETYNKTMFQPETLFTWILRFLRLLKLSVNLNYLPYYMIPERNLMIEKVKNSDLLPFLCTLSDLLKPGLAILTSCETLNKYIHFNLEELSMLLHKLEVSEL